MAGDQPPQSLDDWFLSLLACPGCTARRPLHLGNDQTSLICECGRYSFPITDGIPVLLLESASVLDDTIPAGGKAAGE